jgi:hypothetical protein
LVRACVTKACKESVSCSWIGTTVAAKGILVRASLNTISFQVGGINDARDLGSKHPGFGQGADDVVQQGFQVAHVQLHDVIGQRIRAEGPRGARPLALRSASLTHPLPHLLGIEADQALERFIAEEQGWQRMHALDPQQRLQAIEQDIQDDRDHLALDRRALDDAQSIAHHQLLQAVEEVIQQCAFVQLIDPIDDLLAV